MSKTTIIDASRTVIIGVALTLLLATPTNAQDFQVSLDFQRNPVPHYLYYQDLTLRVDAAGATQIAYTSADDTHKTVPISNSTAYITTGSPWLEIYFYNTTSTPSRSNFTISPLKHGKKWAWSHGLDDNRNLWDYEEARGDPLSGSDEDDRTEQDIIDGVSKDNDNAIGLMIEKGYKGTVFLIGQFVDSVENDHDNRPDSLRDREWIIDEINIHKLVALGWGIGNHHYDKQCTDTYDSLTPAESIAHVTNNILNPIFTRSSKPDYRSIAFAAPNFDNQCDAYMEYVINNSTTLFNETGNNSSAPLRNNPMRVDDWTFSEFTTTYNPPVGYGGFYPYYSELVTRMNYSYDSITQSFHWMAQNSNNTNHYWLNTLSHGGGDIMRDILAVYDQYSHHGTGESWNAPSDEIYSYLVIRDATTLSIHSIEELTNPPPPAFDYTHYLKAISDIASKAATIFHLNSIIRAITQ